MMIFYYLQNKKHFVKKKKKKKCKKNPRFVEFCDTTFKRMQSDIIDLPSFLITPVQRIPRYQVKDL